MSLVNDALKRAKKAQEQNPPATPNLEFKPVEAARPARDPWVHIVTAGMAILGLVVILLAWRFVLQKPPSDELQVQARGLAKAPAQSTTEAPGNIVPVSVPEASTPAPVAPPEPAIAHNAPTTEAAASTSAAVVPAPETAPAKPTPPPLRLQAIFFNPANPTALINGKTLRVGDAFGELRVLAIDRESVDLSSLTQTNHLTLQ